jgi:hypothetical protein
MNRFNSKWTWARSFEMPSRVLAVRPITAMDSPAFTDWPTFKSGRISRRCA